MDTSKSIIKWSLSTTLIFMVACAPKEKKSARVTRVTPGTKTQKVANPDDPSRAKNARGTVPAVGATNSKNDRANNNPEGNGPSESKTKLCRITDNLSKLQQDDPARFKIVSSQSICESFVLNKTDIKDDGTIVFSQRVDLTNGASYNFRDEEISLPGANNDQKIARLIYTSKPGDKENRLYTTYLLPSFIDINNKAALEKADIKVFIIAMNGDKREIKEFSASLNSEKNKTYIQIKPEIIDSVFTNINFVLNIEYNI